MTRLILGGPKRMAHQKRGLRKMIETKGVTALLFDPGTGKTATTLDFLSILALKSARGEARVLVTCPLAAVDTWVTQAGIYVSPQVNYWAEVVGGSIRQRGEALASRGGQPYPSKTKGPLRAAHVSRAVAWGARADHRVTQSQGPDALGDERPRLLIMVTNLDTFSSRMKMGSKTAADFMLESVQRLDPDLVVVDESHKIKGASSNVSRLLGRIGRTVPRRVILTGTVMPSGPMDIYGQWRFLNPQAFGNIRPDGSRSSMTLGSFTSRFAVRGGYMGKEIVGYRNLDEMQRIMAQNAVVATKDDALDLPETTDVIVPVRLSAKERKAYEEMRKDLAVAFQQAEQGEIVVTNRLAQMMRLRQITSGYLPDGKGQEVDLGGSKTHTIVSLVEDTLAGEKRIVIFCMFSREIDMVAERLARDKRTRVEKITGGTPAEERIQIRKRFGSDADERIVIVAQIQTLNLAVNELVTASHAIFGSLSQLRDEIVQSRDRLHRIGQTRPVTFWYALAPGTVDDVIYRTYLERTDLERAMLDHVMEIDSLPVHN